VPARRHGATRSLTVTGVMREHAARAVRTFRIGWRERQVLRDLVRCRTAALGGHLEVCAGGCGYERPVYNSCRNRHCPQCQDARRRDWARRHEAKTLPVPHFQVVFPLPAELRDLARHHPRLVYDLLFEAGSHVLQRLAAQRLGAQVAITAVLHTWTRKMTYHPHVHFLVSAGGLSLDQSRWVPTRTDFLFPVAVMRAMFRGRLMTTLTARTADLPDVRLPKRLWRAKPWVVHVTPPGDRPAAHAVRYLARYVYGVAISDHRLVAADADTVTFRTHGAETLTLPGPEFVRRYLQHVLPYRFRKVREFGLLAPGMTDRLERARSLLPGALPHDDRTAAPGDSPAPDDDATPPPSGPTCPRCGLHPLVRRPLPLARGPP
jgi:putative transposase/transposase-like zinc-binding protein